MAPPSLLPVPRPRTPSAFPHSLSQVCSPSSLVAVKPPDFYNFRWTQTPCLTVSQDLVGDSRRDRLRGSFIGVRSVLCRPCAGK